ncbi:MAG: hypothetical protein QOJ99_1815 [Bryobacterales bacterium]|nr:hypothetical protein [Bryobacterales bacterium]
MIFDHSLGTASRRSRLSARVKTRRVVSEAAAEEQTPATEYPIGARDHDRVDLPESTVGQRPRWRFAWKIAGFALLLLSAIFTVWILHPGTTPPTGIRSRAVLPLENLSGDASQDYSSGRTTDELIAELGQISELRVISRTSVMTYKGAGNADCAEVEGRRRGGRHRLTLRQPDSNHRAFDLDFRRQTFVGPELRGRVARYSGPPENGGSLPCRADHGQIESS